MVSEIHNIPKKGGRPIGSFTQVRTNGIKFISNCLFRNRVALYMYLFIFALLQKNGIARYRKEVKHFTKVCSEVSNILHEGITVIYYVYVYSLM
jgi:hypothetical protein